MDLGWSVLPIPLIQLTLCQVISVFFRFICPELSKLSQEGQVKKFEENFMSFKPAKFYLMNDKN